MALTITSDLTVITNGNDGTWNDIGGGGGSASEPDYFVQGTGCRSRAVSGAAASRGMTVDIGAGNTLDFTSGGANQDELLYFWIQCYTPGLTDNLATAPGLRIRLSEGATNESDFAEWDIAYSDLLADTNLPGNEFFRVYVLDPRCPPTRTSGTWDYNAVRHFGAVLDTNANAKGQNLGIDRICHGRGELIVTGTPDNVNGGFVEILDGSWYTIDDSVAIAGTATARHGIVSVRGQTAFLKGKIVIGDNAGTSATDFSGVSQAFEWEDTYYYDATRIRSAVGYDFSGNFTGTDSTGASYYGISFVGNGTGDTSVDFGVSVGADQGRSGPLFTGSRITTTTLEADDGAVEGVAIYGSSFTDFREVDFSSNASTDVIRGSTFVSTGTINAGPTEGRNNSVISSLPAAYTFYESFINIEAAAAEQLSTADPVTEWTDILNGADLSVPSANAGYVELLGGTTRTNITLLDDDKVSSDNHYAEFIVRFPSGGAGQGTLGPVIAGHATNQDYFYLDIDLVNDVVELFRVSSGTDNSIAGGGSPGAFTMDEDEDYLVLLRRNGTTIEAFISGNSVADGFHTLKLSATDANHTGTAQRLIGIRGDALAGQTGDAPRIRGFGGGPITDNFGAILTPTTASWDWESCNFIQCPRGVAYDNTGSYTMNSINITGSLVGAHNDSGGSVTANFVDSTGAPANSEDLGASDTTQQSAVNVNISALSEGAAITILASATVGSVTEGDTLLQTLADSNGEATYSHNYEGDLAIQVRARQQGLPNAAIADDGGVFTDETTNANSATTNDVNLLPATPVAGDAYYFGHAEEFSRIKIDVTDGNGTGSTITWEYWNGAWTALSDVVDGTNNFETVAENIVSWTLPGDWATTTINSQGPYKYVRARLSTLGSANQTRARKVQLDITRYLPFTQNRTIVSTGLDVVAVWNRDTIAKFTPTD